MVKSTGWVPARTGRWAVLSWAVFVSAAALAQSSKLAGPSDADPMLDALDRAISEIAEQARQDAAATTADAEVIEHLFAEIAALRADLDELRASMAIFQASVERGLIEENERLREVVRLRYGALEPNLPQVPMPNRDLIEEVLREKRVSAVTTAEPVPEAKPAAEKKHSSNVEANGSAKVAAAEPAAYEIVKQWGRTPEMAAHVGGDTSSLKGLVLAVSPAATDDELITLCHRLREEFAEYDNLNIEVFNDVRAARTYAEDYSTEPGRRVLSISKLRNQQRDVALLFRNGRETVIVDGGVSLPSTAASD